MFIMFYINVHLPTYRGYLVLWDKINYLIKLYSFI